MKVSMILTIPFIVGSLFASGPTFSQSKRLLAEKVYFDHHVTFYAGCEYDPLNKGNMIIRDTCGYEPRNPYTKKGKINKRARRIEWEHIVPAENFGRQLPCWKEGGRKYCEKVSAKFREIESDMMNLVPAIGELNGDRNNFRYAAEAPTPGMYGKVLFEVDFKNRRAMINPKLRGDVARIYLYMSKKYGIRLSSQEQKMMEAWSKMDPLTPWELEREKRIRSLSQ